MALKEYTGSNALTFIFTLVKEFVNNKIANKVDKESGKGLSTNDYTNAEKDKLASIETNAQVNKLESVKLNGITLDIVSKAVDVIVPTQVSDLTNDVSYQTKTEVQGLIKNKVDVADLDKHIQDTNVHVTAQQKQAWDNKLDTEDIAHLATKTEVDKKANIVDVYTKIQIDSKNYQNENQVQALINEAVGSITGIQFEVVQTLPEQGNDGVIYLINHNHGNGDVYDEYIWVSSKNSFEKIGNTDIDLSAYVLNSELVELSNAQIQSLWDSVMN